MFIDREDEDLIQLIKSMSLRELDLFAVEIREKLIDTVSKTGGHLASNLGVVELTLALHRVFDTPRDKIVWDVGHQSYVHKMLTGRLGRMDTLRQLDGISGFPKITESEHDCFDSGHSSTSISVALGYARARDLQGGTGSCIAVIGDGSLTGGVAFEALNAAGQEGTPLIVILNDNQMAISKSVGGMARHLHELRISSRYLKFKESVKKKLDSGSSVYRALQSARDTLKHLIVPTGIFEEFGLKYFGPIDGHDLSELIPALEAARQMNRPVLLHVITKKGKGYLSAEKDPERFHGIGPFDPSSETGRAASGGNTYSNIFGRRLAELAEIDPRICAVSAAMTDSTGLGLMQEKFPSRVFDVGIAEQHAVSFAAGLALGGQRPVVAMYSTFIQRAYDQIVDVCLQKLPVIFAIDRAGVTGRDGETHQGVFDIAILSALPNMTIFAPRDGKELCGMLEQALRIDGPCAIRYPRGNAPAEEDDVITAGTAAELIGPDGEFAILSAGSMTAVCAEAAGLLRARGVSCAVYDLRTLKPLQRHFLDGLRGRYKAAVVCEDGSIAGGAGQAIAAYLAEDGGLPVLCLGWPDRFIEHGGVDELRKRYSLDGEGIAAQAEAFFEEKARYNPY